MILGVSWNPIHFFHCRTLRIRSTEEKKAEVWFACLRISNISPELLSSTLLPGTIPSVPTLISATRIVHQTSVKMPLPAQGIKSILDPSGTEPSSAGKLDQINLHTRS